MPKSAPVPACRADAKAIGDCTTVAELLSSQGPTSFKTPEDFAAFAGSLMTMLSTGVGRVADSADDCLPSLG